MSFLIFVITPGLSFIGGPQFFSKAPGLPFIGGATFLLVRLLVVSEGFYVITENKNDTRGVSPALGKGLKRGYRPVSFEAEMSSQVSIPGFGSAIYTGHGWWKIALVGLLPQICYLGKSSSSAAAKLEELKEVRTSLDSQGLFEDLWNGLSTSPDTPQEIQDRINQRISA